VLLGLLVLLSAGTAVPGEFRISPISPSNDPASKVFYSTPAGWERWQDKVLPVEKLDTFNDRKLRAYLSMACPFVQPECRSGPACPKLEIRTYHLESWNARDVPKNVQQFAEALQHDHMSHKDPKPAVYLADTFDGSPNGTVSVWGIRCVTYDDYFLTVIVQGDTLVDIYLQAPDAAQIESKLNGLKELVRSVRIVNH